MLHEKISFHSDEANTDKQLKEFIKKRIEKDFNCIPPTTIISQLTIIQDDTKRTVVKRWVNMLFTDYVKPNEPWFNNSLRKFILKFLLKYDKFSKLSVTMSAS